MDPQTKHDLKDNVKNLPRMFSAWFIALTGLLTSWWLALPEPKQIEYLQMVPVALPAEVYPLLLIVIGLALRAWPQQSLTPPTPDAQDTQPEGDAS